MTPSVQLVSEALGRWVIHAILQQWKVVPFALRKIGRGCSSAMNDHISKDTEYDPEFLQEGIIATVVTP